MIFNWIISVDPCVKGMYVLWTQDTIVIFLVCVKSIGIFSIFYYSSISALGLYKAFVCSSLIFIQFYTASLAWVPSNESVWADYKLSLHK